MFTKVSFQNLRCFKDFTLENLTPITLISGRNNVGKTTVLEGIFLLLAYRNMDVFQKINNWRSLEPFVRPSSPWETLFPNMDVPAQELRVSVTDEHGMTRSVSLSKDNQFSLTAFAPVSKGHSFLQPTPESDVLKFIYECSPGYDSTETRWFYPANSGIAVHSDGLSSLPPMPFGIYASPSANPLHLGVAEWLGNVEMKDQKERLVKNLRCLYDEITDVFLVPASGGVSVFARLGAGRTLPIRAMGDGINRLLFYLSVMIANPGGVFLFDEIETGFHHSFYPKLWELIARVAKETGSQVFAATHSYECLSDAVDGVAEVDPSLLTYFRLGKEEQGIVAHSFPGEDLAFALERNMEVR